MTQKDSQKTLTALVNSSGFPLQIAIEHLIDRTTREHGWKTLLREHPWKNDNYNTSGFIDLIVEDSRDKEQVLVIECKRVKEAQWVFLVPKLDSIDRKVCHCWVSQRNQKSSLDTKCGWSNETKPPVTQLSEFCTVHGHDPKYRPMLERVASELVDATEALAKEEFELNFGTTLMRYYFPVIVTTAELKVCNFDPGKINIATGEISDAVFSTVPAVRFHKTLSTPLSSSGSPLDIAFGSYKNLSSTHNDYVRTVLVINASHLVEFLEYWS